MIKFVLVLSLLGFSFETPSERVFPLRMPSIPPKYIAEDNYLCTAFETNPKEAEYITEFKPHVSNPSTIHHILIFGCETPQDPKAVQKGYVWNCQDVSNNNCGRGERSKTLYSWSRNAPTLTLPEEVGFKVGGDTGLKYLVLHVHYVNVSRITNADKSGFSLKMVPKSSNKVTKSVGMLWLGSDQNAQKTAVIPAQSKLNFENACPINNSKVLHPIAMRPNTNGRGVVVSSWLLHQNKGKTEWTLMGRWSPNPNQAFYSIRDKDLVIKPNDWMAMRCTYENRNPHDINFGFDDSNETCNLYLMYFVNSDDNLQDKRCVSFGPPYYSWKSDRNLPGRAVPEWVDRAASLPEFDN